MTNQIRILLISGAILGVTWLISTLKGDSPASKAAIEDQVPPEDTLSTESPPSAIAPASIDNPAIVLTDAETQAAKEFEARVADYMALQQKLEATIPTLPDKATPEQIDQHQQALVALITTARKDAKRGEFFTPGMEALVRRALGVLVGGPDGTSLKATIMDENPGTLDVGVNDRYPDVAPVSSMPVQLLETLPRLPAELEYRFLGRHLVLVCTAARIVLDLTPDVLP
ncbi:MAG: hypothetical protein EHM89_04030 [Acidobacteria bacterium]|nr:MAG: hypothetical protein EHM89_04030 [Acidobacteriota bacterium]